MKRHFSKFIIITGGLGLFVLTATTAFSQSCTPNDCYSNGYRGYSNFGNGACDTRHYSRNYRGNFRNNDCSGYQNYSNRSYRNNSQNYARQQNRRSARQQPGYSPDIYSSTPSAPYFDPAEATTRSEKISKLQALIAYLMAVLSNLLDGDDSDSNNDYTPNARRSGNGCAGGT